jgi:hypothetical protein
MKLQDLTLQQLKEIRDGAPEGATHVVDYAGMGKYDYLKDPDTWAAWYGSHWSKPGVLLDLSDKTIIKLSDIRTELKARPKFKVGDLVVLNTGRKIYRVDHIYRTVVWLDSGKESCDVVDIRDVLRHATPEEEAAGHRVDETEEELAVEAAAWRECREPCRFDRLEVEPANGWAINPTRNKVCIEEETPELFESKHCSPRPMVDHELNLSVGQKHDQSKPRYSLIPSGSLEAIIGVLEYGARKYAPDNWKHVENARERYYNASMWHIQAWWSGEQNDPETNLPHLAHAACSLMFLMWLDGEQGE